MANVSPDTPEFAGIAVDYLSAQNFIKCARFADPGKMAEAFNKFSKREPQAAHLVSLMIPKPYDRASYPRTATVYGHPEISGLVN